MDLHLEVVMIFTFPTTVADQKAVTQIWDTVTKPQATTDMDQAMQEICWQVHTNSTVMNMKYST